MNLTNNRHQREHRRKIQRTFDDSPKYVDIKQSILDLRPLHPQLTNEQFARWYEKKYRVKAEEVLRIVAGAADVL
ncbi:hypothetical protein [Paenibacillus alkalitolerans]|uniref:hypothetical protein n=1 Tax=Paenibacillus alkalitolerans TaxID=2799335 RepID=UPI0018F6B3E6|nr:hypothetical protein [Paenibacillus alkalitolerans]